RRFIDPSYMRKLFEVYIMNDEPLLSNLQEEVNGLIAKLTPKADVVIATDFGHGMLEEGSIGCLIEHSKFLAVNTQSNSANMGYNLITKYPKADYTCIDAPEAQLACSDRLSSIGDIAHRILERMDCHKIIITRGKHGCVTYERGGPVHTIPAFAKNVID